MGSRCSRGLWCAAAMPVLARSVSSTWRRSRSGRRSRGRQRASRQGPGTSRQPGAALARLGDLCRWSPVRLGRSCALRRCGGPAGRSGRYVARSANNRLSWVDTRRLWAVAVSPEHLRFRLDAERELSSFTGSSCDVVRPRRRDPVGLGRGHTWRTRGTAVRGFGRTRNPRVRANIPRRRSIPCR